MTKNYIIGLSNNPISKKYMEIVIPEIQRVTCEEHVILWEGTTPETMPDTLQFRWQKETHARNWKKEFTQTEKAVWYSHYLLWKQIIKDDEPAWIFEHDVDLSYIDFLPSEWGYNQHAVFPEHIGYAACYWFTPLAANLAVKKAEKFVIYDQVDTWLHRVFYDHEIGSQIAYCPEYKIKQLLQYGNTIDHEGERLED